MKLTKTEIKRHNIYICCEIYRSLDMFHVTSTCAAFHFYHLREWFVLPSSLLIDPPEEYRHAVKSQEKIGWHRFTRGYLSTNWSVLQDNFCLMNNHKQLGDSWSAKDSLWWIKKTHDIWMQRNDIQHNQQPGLQSRLEAEVLHNVQQLYQQYDSLPSIDKEILDLPLDERIKQPIPTLKRWLDITAPTVALCTTHFQQVLQRNNQLITSFFSRRDVPCNQNHSQSTVTISPENFETSYTSHQHTQLQHHSNEATFSDSLLSHNSQDSLSSCRK
jgi:hypothetical protein